MKDWILDVTPGVLVIASFTLVTVFVCRVSRHFHKAV